MAANRNIIIKGEHSMILGKVHWMNIDSRKNSSKTFFLPKRNAKEFIQQLFEESAVDPKDVKGIVFICNENEFDTWQKAYEFRRKDEHWKHMFLRGYKPKKIIFMYHLPGFDFQKVIDLLKIEDSIILEDGYEYLSTAAIDKILHVMGENPIPYDIAPQCANIYAFGARIAVSHPFEVIQEVKLSTFKCKKLKISLKIDVNSFYDFKVEPINDVKDFCEEFEQLDILKAVQKLPFSPRKVQITFNKHECWLLFTCDNGCAHETFDVDEDDPLMVTLQTVDGERKIAIEFLLALIIKHSLKATLMGHRIPSKWDKATIRFEDFAPNETLKNAFIKAGKLLKMKIDFC
uniref:DUF38 domain-containing protein n=1 Tax=Panagrolaimus sp. ES5 TaxID=591445 RepID=A0AC34G6E8_9BILA